MLKSLVLSFLFASACCIPSDFIVSTSESKQRTNVQEFENVCSTSGYSVKGIVWSSCSSGKSSVIGCSVPDGGKIRFGETWTDGGVEWICEQLQNGVALKPVSCIFKGNKYGLGERFQHDSFFYRCEATESGAMIRPVGCSDSEGDLVHIGDAFKKSKFLFQCVLENGKIYTVGIKCIVETGARYSVSIGEKFFLGGYTYECQRKGKRSIRTAVVGCADKYGAEVKAGQEFIEGFAVYQCQVEEGEFSVKVVGCYVKDHRSGQFDTYKLGQQWYESYTPDFGHIMECAFEDDALFPKPVKCIHRSEKGDHSLDINCGALFGEKVFICKKTGDSSVLARFMPYPQDMSFDIFLYTEGLAGCETTLKTV